MPYCVLWKFAYFSQNRSIYKFKCVPYTVSNKLCVATVLMRNTYFASCVYGLETWSLLLRDIYNKKSKVLRKIFGPFKEEVSCLEYCIMRRLMTYTGSWHLGGLDERRTWLGMRVDVYYGLLDWRWLLTYHRKVGSCLQEYTASQSRRQQPTFSRPWKQKISETVLADPPPLANNTNEGIRPSIAGLANRVPTRTFIPYRIRSIFLTVRSIRKVVSKV